MGDAFTNSSFKLKLHSVRVQPVNSELSSAKQSLYLVINFSKGSFSSLVFTASPNSTSKSLNARSSGRFCNGVFSKVSDTFSVLFRTLFGNFVVSISVSTLATVHNGPYLFNRIRLYERFITMIII